MSQDEQHLDLLSIFHYVVGGITALLSCIPFLHVAMGIAMLCGAFEGQNPPPRALGWLFILFPAVFILIGWALSVVIIVAGRKLKRRTSRTFCLVVAGLECIMMPFGTVLGVFTLIVLMRESVGRLFASNNSIEATPDGAPQG